LAFSLPLTELSLIKIVDLKSNKAPVLGMQYAAQEFVLKTGGIRGHCLHYAKTNNPRAYPIMNIWRGAPSSSVKPWYAARVPWRVLHDLRALGGYQKPLMQS
jgi:hypothetical protein